MKFPIILTLFSLLFSELKVSDEAPTFFVRDLTEKNFFLSDTLLAMTEDKLAMPITMSGRKTDIMLSFRAVGQDGQIISQLTKQLNLNAIPDNFALNQAYPNPFNPVTTLSFGLPEDTNVLLEVYDISGRLIKQLQNNSMQAGYHSIAWNATMYSSGIYFVKMVAGKFHHTQKLMLIK